MGGTPLSSIREIMKAFKIPSTATVYKTLNGGGILQNKKKSNLDYIFQLIRFFVSFGESLTLARDYHSLSE